MFCEIAGQSHPRINVEKVTHYVRHQCSACSYFAIFGMCRNCFEVFEDYIETDWNWTFCPRCGYRCPAMKVWTVYESVEE